MCLFYFRNSRIAQPIGKRSSIQEHVPATGSTIRPSYALRVSATPARTPTRTPLRSASKDRNTNTVVPMTAEKEKAPVDDKVFLNAKTKRVHEELAKIEGFDDLIHKGLKTLTIKQFVVILQHFLRPVVQNIQFDGSNYVDVVYNLLQVLEYPYTINKSSLKTPSALHCINSIVVLLGWLAEFNIEQEIDQIIHYKPIEDMPVEVTKMLMDRSAEAFRLWNNNQEQDFDAMKEQLRRDYIEKRIGSDVNLDDDLHQLRIDVEQLRKEKRPLSLQKEFNDLTVESQQLKIQIDGNKKTNKELSEKLESFNHELEAKQKSERHAKRELQAARNKITNQKMSVDERKNHLTELSRRKTVLAIKRDTVLELKESGDGTEIQLSNFIQKKFICIDRLNNLIHKLASDLNMSGMGEKIDPSIYEINATKPSEGELLDQQLIRLRDVLKELNERYSEINGNIRQSIVVLEGEKNSFQTESDQLTKKLNEVSAKLEMINSDTVMKEQELRTFIDNMEAVMTPNNERILQISQESEEIEKKIDKLTEENNQRLIKNEAFADRAVAKCQELFEQRKKEVEEYQTNLEQVKKAIREWEIENGEISIEFMENKR